MAVLEGALGLTRHADGRFEVTSAPDVIRWSLEAAVAADVLLVAARGREVTFAGQVTYRVEGWDDAQSCLVLRKVAI